MTPILSIPVLNAPDLFARCIESIDIDCELIVVDNSPEGFAWDIVPDGAHVIEPAGNLGYSASVNLVIKSRPHEPYWLFANADVEFAPGDLSRLVGATESGDRGWVGIGDWRAFGLTAEAVERVGFWDENFHPAFCEDADYERRCDLAGVRRGFIEGETTHVRSVSLREYGHRNQHSYPRNVDYYREKWGVPVRAPGGYATPFDSGREVTYWPPPPLSRLRENAWS